MTAFRQVQTDVSYYDLALQDVYEFCRADDTFWDGEYCGTLGAKVTRTDTLNDGQAHHPYAVFASKANVKHGIAIANYDMDKEIRVSVQLDNVQHLERYRLGDDPPWHPLKNGITLPVSSAAVGL